MRILITGRYRGLDIRFGPLAEDDDETVEYVKLTSETEVADTEEQGMGFRG